MLHSIFKISPLVILLSLHLQILTSNAQQADDYRVVEQKILETLLKSDYDRRIRPISSRHNATGTIVSINMFIRSFDFIDDVNMQYGVQLTFRQEWQDIRLQFSHLNPPEKLKYLTLTSTSLIWIPDLFFSNEKTANIHDMLLPNSFIRIHPDGRVLYSVRLSMTLSCPMELRDFPFDEQTCFMRMASYGYTTDDLIFEWKNDTAPPLQLAEDLTLPRFFLRKFVTEKCDSITSTGSYSCLKMSFNLLRDHSYYNSQIYLPCAMVVVIGWLTFWIDRKEVTGRMVVLVATLLVMATLSGSLNETVPKVSYTKASDEWAGVCFVFIFIALLQFFIVHYCSTCEQSKNSKRHPELEREQSKLLENSQGGDKATTRENRRATDDLTSSYWTLAWFKQQDLSHQIDMITRVVYPLAFFIFNLVYWAKYC